MTAPNTAPQRPVFVAGEVQTPRLSFAGKLRSGELLTGTPTAIEVDEDDVAVSPSDLTISDVAINAASLVMDGETVLAGQAVTLKVVGFRAGSSYRIRVAATTDSTPARTLRGFLRFSADTE